MRVPVVVVILCGMFLLLLSDGGKAAKQAKVQNIEIDEKNQIWIYDDIFATEQIENLLNVLVFPLPGTLQFAQENFTYAMENGLSPFVKRFDTNLFKETEAQKWIKNAVEKSLKTETELTNVWAEILHSLDPKPPVKQFCNENVYYVTVFVLTSWGHNSYGQLSFYTSENVGSKERKEIIHTVHPKPGRAVVWPSCVIQTVHPPSVNYFTNLFMLKLQYKIADAHVPDDHGMNLKSVQVPKFGGWKFHNIDAGREIDYDKHLKRTYYDKMKRGIFVFDDLFTQSELKQFREMLLKSSSLKTAMYDGTALEDNDNVAWISGYEVEEFINTPVWPRIQELLFYISGEKDWYPYDVAMNYIRSGDHTRIHPDAEPHQFEYTYLLYLTENVTQTDFGETAFFERQRLDLDGIHHFTGPGGEEFEPIAAVWPKYGRVVIFRNVIKHSARPLGTSYLPCRYTFACKVSRSKRLSMIKQIYEKMEMVFDPSVDEENFNRDLQTGHHDDPATSDYTDEMLEKKLLEMKMRTSKMLNEIHQSMSQLI